jgi:MFS family permease
VNRWFVLLTGVSALSKLGNTFLYVALPWAVLNATGSPLLATTSIGVQTVPYVVSPLIGVVIDRMPRRLVFVYAEILQGVAVAVLPLLLSYLPIVWCFAAVLALGVGSVASSVTSDFSLVPSLVPPSRLEWANSRYNTVLMVARFAGPACAGAVVRSSGVSVALWCDALTFLATAVVGLALPVRGEPKAVGKSLRLLREGFAYFRYNGHLKGLTASLAIYNAAAGAMPEAILVVGAAHWRWSITRVGLALSGGALAGAVGAHLSGVLWAGVPLTGRITRWVRCATLCSPLLLVPWPYAALTVYYVQAFAEGGVNVSTMTLRQRIIPAEFVGRANVIVRMCVTGAVPVSSAVLGASTGAATPVLFFLPVVVGSLVSLLWWHHADRAATRTPGLHRRPTRGVHRHPVRLPTPRSV